MLGCHSPVRSDLDSSNSLSKKQACHNELAVPVAQKPLVNIVICKNCIAGCTRVASCLSSCTLTRTHHSHSLRTKNHLVEKLGDYSVRPLQRQGQGLGRVGNVSTVHTHAQSQVALISAPSLYVWP